jgi:M6 family metalloprotease-like protein
VLHFRAVAVAAAVVLAATTAAAAPAAPGKRGRTTPPAHSISRDNATRALARLAAPAAAPRKGTTADSLAFVVLRVEFPDLAFGASPPADELHDRFYYEVQFGYVRQYFDAASKGRLKLGFDVAPVVAVAPLEAALYGNVAVYDSAMIELTRAAVAQNDADIDFASYDGVLVVHAGPGQESDIAGDSPTQIWSGFLDDRTFRESLSTPDSTIAGLPTLDGVLVTNVVILPEWQVQDLALSQGTRLGSLGVYCHEVGQRIGLLPMFDASPARFPDSQGLGNFDLMAYGLWVANGFIPSQPSAFNRVLAGWVDPIEIAAGTQVIELRDFERGAADSTVLRVRISERESFLVTYILEDPDGPRTNICNGVPDGPRRFFAFDDQNGNCDFDFTDADGDSVLSPGDPFDTYAGAEWDFFMTDQLGGATAGEGWGLLILHIDAGVLQEVLARGGTNVQGDAARKAADVEEADGIQDLDRAPDNPRAFGSADDYWRRGRVFGAGSDPDTRSADGAPTGVAIELAALPDSTAASPGERAHVRVTIGAASTAAAAPRRRARGAAPQRQVADLVALPLGDGREALVVPGEASTLALLDADLENATGPDSLVWTAWRAVPPGLAGEWVGAPAVGDVDGDGTAELVVCANGDSAGVTRGRVFAWHRDGREVRDLDGDPGTDFGLLWTAAGPVSQPLLLPAEAEPRSAIVVVHQATPDSAAAVRIAFAGGEFTATRGRTFAGVARGAPIAARAHAPALQVAFTLVDSAAARQTIVFEPFSGAVQQVATVGWTLAPLWLASADFDADGRDEFVVAGADGSFWAQGRVAQLGAPIAAAPAIADVNADGTLEIVVATQTALYVLSATGAALPGWPVRLPAAGAPAPASPLVVDLDAQGGVELVQHLHGGGLGVWSAGGLRRRDLEIALPAFAAATPLVRDLDGDGRFELAAIGRFARSQRYLAAPESLVTEEHVELAVVSWTQARAPVWGEAGGGPAHTYRDDSVRRVVSRPNDAALASFAVGPNPARDEVRARIDLGAGAEVRCQIYDLEGELVRAMRRTGSAGTAVEFVFDVRDLAPGVYFARLQLSTGGERVRPVALRR